MKVRQRQFWFNDAHDRPLPSRPIFVDGFAGGGGASEGFKLGCGRAPDVAINHDKAAIAMHMANHPATKHYCENIWLIDPVEACEGQQIAAAWFSPDCTDHSKAKGDKPKRKGIRALAWVVIKWAEMPPDLRPRVIFVENVEEFRDWGPLDRKTQKRRADKKGVTFELWAWKLRELGYDVEWRVLRASDYGSPTTRKRLFIIARCDGRPIVWPEPTHASPKEIDKRIKRHGHCRLQRWRTAAEIIDWTIPCPSIFASKEEIREQLGIAAQRPLKPKTLKRIAEGIRRYVIESADPFIVKTNHGGAHYRGQPIDRPLSTVTMHHGYGVVDPVLAPFAASLQNGGSIRRIDDPHRTITASAKDCNVVVTPILTGCGGRAGQSPPCSVDRPMTTLTAKGDRVLVSPALVQMGYGEHANQPARVLDLAKPLGTVTAGGNKFALCSAFIAKHFGGVVGIDARNPFPTVTTIGTQNQLVAAHLIKNNYGDKQAFAMDEPLRTVCAGGTHRGIVETRLAQVRAFLWKYYGSGGQWNSLNDPAPTITVKDRLALGIVLVGGEPWQIVDIGMRMLTPRELFNAMGFRGDYDITTGVNGKPATKTIQTARCGNSVCPQVVAAIVRANVQPEACAA